MDMIRFGGLGLWCLTPLSTICQLYRDDGYVSSYVKLN